MKLLMRCLLLVLLLSSTVFSSDGIINPEIDSCYEKAVITARKESWKRINSGGAGSGSVAIMENGELVYFEGFAMADREKSLRVDEETVFNIASVSKVFAATAIMLLVDEGKIDLDEPVTRYLTEFKSPDPRYREVTVRMLLNHTSGLAGSTLANTFGYVYNQDANKVIMENISNSNLIHDPGSVAVYCNDGFALAEMIVERVSGTNYIDFLSKGIFEPLNMDKTDMTTEAFEKGVPVVFFS
ncbi:MAG: serine hydrolase domain-containing protein [Thermotogota bacterium]|nr:serine hydrolase domain-containing protein [Thermotogota bacterium]